MSPKSVLALAGLLATAQAIQVTSPSKDDKWDLSKKPEIKWDSVDTDPSEFKIVLEDHSVFPVKETVLADKVKTSDGKFTVSTEAAASSDYKISLMSTSSKNQGILAQSEQFAVEGGSDDKKSDDDSSSATSATGTATVSGSATATASAKSSASATASDAASSASASATGAEASATSAPDSAAPAVKLGLGLVGTAAAAFWMLL